MEEGERLKGVSYSDQQKPFLGLLKVGKEKVSPAKFGESLIGFILVI